MKSYKRTKEWHLYIKFETNHTIWTNTKPLTGNIFLCTIFCRINEAFWERVHCQYLETFRDNSMASTRLKYASLQGSGSRKNSLHHMVFSCLLKRYGPSLQNDTKHETTSCFIAEKTVLDEPLFCTGSLWKRFSGVNPSITIRSSVAQLVSAHDNAM